MPAQSLLPLGVSQSNFKKWRHAGRNKLTVSKIFNVTKHRKKRIGHKIKNPNSVQFGETISAQQYSNRKRKNKNKTKGKTNRKNKKTMRCVINCPLMKTLNAEAPLRLHLFHNVFPLFFAVSGGSHSTVVITVFQEILQEGSCLEGRSPGLLCILHANRFQKGL